MIWFLILKSGVIVGTIGPSPLTMPQCEHFAQERTVERDQVLSSGVNLLGEKLSEEQKFGLSQLSFKCVERAERPKHGERL